MCGFERRPAAVGFGCRGADPARAGPWIAALPKGRDRDMALGNLASALAFSHPAKAAEWVKSIDDPVVRANAADSVERFWKKQNPDAATAWRAKLRSRG